MDHNTDVINQLIAVAIMAHEQKHEHAERERRNAQRKRRDRIVWNVVGAAWLVIVTVMATLIIANGWR